MSHSDQAIAEIAKLEPHPSMVPTQSEVKEFVKKFSALERQVVEYRQFSTVYSKQGGVRKWYDNDVARDKMLSSIAVVGELSVLANKLLALNVVFAQKIDGQTTNIGEQGDRIAKNQSELVEHSHKLRAVQSIISSGLEELHKDIVGMQATQECLESSLTEFGSRFENLQDQNGALAADLRIFQQEAAGNAQKLIAVKELLQSSIELTQTRIAGLETTQGELEQSVRTCESVFDDLTLSTDSLKSTTASVMEQIARISSAVDGDAIQIASLDESIVTLRHDSDSTNKQIVDLATEVTGLANKVNHEFRELHELHDSIHRKMIGNENQSANQIIALDAGLSDHQEKIAELRHALNSEGSLLQNVQEIVNNLYGIQHELESKVAVMVERNSASTSKVATKAYLALCFSVPAFVVAVISIFTTH